MGADHEPAMMTTDDGIKIIGLHCCFLILVHHIENAQTGEAGRRGFSLRNNKAW